MATDSSTLAWKIPWTEETGRLQSMGSLRVGHDWATELNWTEWSSGFPYFLQFKSEFGNKEFMIWATVSSWSCFCWLCIPSPSLAGKNIVDLISVLTIWWCPHVESFLVLLEWVFAMTCAFSWQNSISLCPASFCTPRPNVPITPAVSWLPTFAFQSTTVKMTSFLMLVIEGVVGLHRTIQLKLLQHQWLEYKVE